ncbi:N-6 DNA methylase [Deinococcus sp. YIM 134068]|uniref:restriction endonuclease subunit M n=1 Tax=Deinococcus lichenicola TaxID=3118910 RepID=UPI002F927428
MKTAAAAGVKTVVGLKPEEVVRQRVIKDLKALGWQEHRLRWKPEWQIPDTPHDLTKRERGQKFSTCGSADLVAFADDTCEWHALQVIFEFKAPDIDGGRAQLMRYLSNEPMAKMGFWTNGEQTLAVYKSHSSGWVMEPNATLPRPGDDLTKPPESPPTWNMMRTPSEAELSGALRRVLATVVVGDPNVTRAEDQLREVTHVLFVKLESDSVASHSANQNDPVDFRIYGDAVTKVTLTAKEIRKQFRSYFNSQRTRIFNPNDREDLLLSDETIYALVAELTPYRILGDKVDLLSKAFQIFRSKALKSGEGQFLTPLRVIRPCVMAMEITSRDKVIDPACGTGGFLVEALRQVADRDFPTEAESWNLVKWANDKLYGIDKDDIGVKLTRAIMVAMRDGSTHAMLGDAVRLHQWPQKYPLLAQTLGASDKPGEKPKVHEQFTVVITNPPFGEDLKVKAADCRQSNYSISKAAAMKGVNDYVDLEIGLVYLELAHRLLQVGGRVGIILPETYFFSHSYRWLAGWLHGRLELRGMLNIPMEAFEEFCRAKTNFYIFEKVGNGDDGTPKANK